jgi:hypothetical protein
MFLSKVWGMTPVIDQRRLTACCVEGGLEPFGKAPIAKQLIFKRARSV